MPEQYLTTDELDQLFSAWEEEWGQDHTSPSGVRKKIFRDQRRFEEACEALCRMFKDQYNYTLKEMSTIREKVLDRVCPVEAAKSTSQYKRWRELKKEQFMRAANIAFEYNPIPSEGFQTAAKAKPEAPPTTDDVAPIKRQQIDIENIKGYDASENNRISDEDILKKLGLDDE